MMLLLYVIICSNSLFSILYFILNVKRKEKYFAFFFFTFPIISELLFLIFTVTKSVYDKKGDLGYLTARSTFEEYETFPDSKQELDVVPVRDAMLMSNPFEKRNLILKQLKKGIEKNYQSVMVAATDSDSESVHYIVSAKMEVYKELRKSLNDAAKCYEKENSLLAFEQLLDSMTEFLDSGLASEIEKNGYLQEYFTLVEHNAKIIQNIFYFDNYFKYAFAGKAFEKMQTMWEDLTDHIKSETMYLKMLEVYYESKDKNNFYLLYDKLCDSDIMLSSEGMATIRYWKKGKNKCYP